MGKKPAEKAAKAAEKTKETKAKSKDKAKSAEVEAKADGHAEEGTKPGHVHKHHASSKSRSEKKCKMKACKRRYKAKGYCVAHYRMWRHGAYGKKRYTCCHDIGCFKPMGMNRHGYCEEHFQNYYVKGMEVTKVAVPAAPAKEEKAAAG